MAEEALRERVARAICRATCPDCHPDNACRGGEAFLSEAAAAIAAYEAWQGEQRLAAHQEMVTNPAWAVEMFGRGRGDEDEGATP